MTEDHLSTLGIQVKDPLEVIQPKREYTKYFLSFKLRYVMLS